MSHSSMGFGNMGHQPEDDNVVSYVRKNEKGENGSRNLLFNFIGGQH